MWDYNNVKFSIWLPEELLLEEEEEELLLEEEEEELLLLDEEEPIE